MTALKKCTECGGKGSLRRDFTKSNWYRTYVYCNNCHKMTHFVLRPHSGTSEIELSKDVKWVIKKWNEGKIVENTNPFVLIGD